MRLTRKSVATLSLPKGKPYLIVWDDELPGFGIRLNPTNRTWVLQYRLRGKSRRETIGRVETVSIELARDTAKKTLARIHLGEDPRADRLKADARRTLTFGPLCDRYLKSIQARLKPRYFLEVRRHLKKDWAALSALPISDITRALVAAELERISQDNGPIAANRARAALSAFFAYALGMGLAEQNPVVGTIKPGDEVKRDRVLTDVEFTAIWKAAGDHDYGRILRLLMLTGQRRDEVGGMRWSEVNLDTGIWTILSERTKNRRAHEVPLSETALQILRKAPRVLDRDLVFGAGKGGFSGWSKAKMELGEVLSQAGKSLMPWRLHDIRRTVATGMANLGVAPHVVEAILNHISGSRAGVAGIYNRATYRDEKRDAVNRWSHYVEGL